MYHVVSFYPWGGLCVVILCNELRRHNPAERFVFGVVDTDPLAQIPLNGVRGSLLEGLIIENLQLFTESLHEFVILLAGFLC